MKMLITFVFLVTSISSFANVYRVQKVKTLGSLKHKVIFQSTDLKKIKNSNVLKGKLVSQWGTQVYEVVNGLYACNQNNYCKLTDYERIATFEKCVVKAKKVSCSKKIGGNSSTAGSDEIIVHDSPDSVYDEYDHRRNYDEYSEFPVRVNGEFDDVTF